MTRMHIHISVADLTVSKRFYTTLFGAVPHTDKEDYVQWKLDDPAVNFVISAHTCGGPGIDHVGLETEDRDTLDAITARLHAAGATTVGQESTTCCYAVSDKTWVEDPSGVRWETFFTHGSSTTYGADATAHPTPS